MPPRLVTTGPNASTASTHPSPVTAGRIVSSARWWSGSGRPTRARRRPVAVATISGPRSATAGSCCGLRCPSENCRSVARRRRARRRRLRVDGFDRPRITLAAPTSLDRGRGPPPGSRSAPTGDHGPGRGLRRSSPTPPSDRGPTRGTRGRSDWRSSQAQRRQQGRDRRAPSEKRATRGAARSRRSPPDSEAPPPVQLTAEKSGPLLVCARRRCTCYPCHALDPPSVVRPPPRPRQRRGVVSFG